MLFIYFEVLGRVFIKNGNSRRILQSKGELLWKAKVLSENKQILARKFCVVAGEFSDPWWLMNTLTQMYFFSKLD